MRTVYICMVMAWTLSSAPQSRTIYIIMAHIVLFHVAMAHIVMAHIVIAHIVMAHIVIAHIVMACMVIAHIVMTPYSYGLDSEQYTLVPVGPIFRPGELHSSYGLNA